MTHEAIIFDLDGTLLDTLADIGESMNRTLAAFGLPTHAIEPYKTMVGDGVEVLARRVLPESNCDAETIAKLGAAYRADYARNWAVHSAPYAGVVDLLAELARRGVRLAVLSNKPHAFTIQCVEQFLPGVGFELVLGAGKFPHKPDPAGAIHIATTMKLPPERFVYLGDTNTDMFTATRAQMFPVGATWGFRSREELLASGAKYLVESPAGLLNLFHRP